MKNETAKAGAQFLAQLLNDPQVLEALMPVFAQIGARIADQTAKRISERHSDAIMPAKDAVVPVSDCLEKLGISMPTFKKHFLDTGKLKLVPPPESADRRQKYVLAKDFSKVIAAVPMRVIRLPKAA